MKTFISLIIILALALLSIWLQDIFKETPIVKIKKDKHFPDYFMENFSITSMDENGQPSYVLTAQRMEHFADDDSAELVKPLIEFQDTNGNWSIAADRAHLLGDKSVIHLYDNVKVTRMNSASSGSLAIETSYLKIHTENKIAETDRQAHIKTRDLELDTLGMVFDNSQGILQLMSKVKGSYAPVQ